MAMIRLLDARRGLYRKCEELFGDARIAESIYRFLCDAIEECEDVAHKRKKGKWIDDCSCSICHWIHEDDKGFALLTNYNFCPNCGADMRKEKEDAH